jgi:hypothetical protein
VGRLAALETLVKRRAQGKTRTGAIPFCMAEVSPQRARESLCRDRLTFFAERSAAGLGYHEVMHGPYAGYAHDLDDVVTRAWTGLSTNEARKLASGSLFAASHPAAGDA